MRTRVKFCGITRVEDALEAAALGVDAIGLVFAPASARALAPEAAARIVAALPPFVARVGLFVDADDGFVRSTCAVVALDLLQFHGREPAAYCRRFGKPYVKALPMGGDADFAALAAPYGDAAALLLDAHASGEQGGTGRRFAWDRVPREHPRPLVLAGGLTPENVGDAIARVAPYAVDVSSGIESAPGIKDSGKMSRFIDEVRRAG